jgi:hypothetical protein
MAMWAPRKQATKMAEPSEQDSQDEDLDLESLLEYGASDQLKKSFSEILASGIKHKGGLAQLALAEQEARASATGFPRQVAVGSSAAVKTERSG